MKKVITSFLTAAFMVTNVGVSALTSYATEGNAIFSSTIITPTNCSAESVSVPLPTDYVTNDIMENSSETSEDSATTTTTASTSVLTTTASSQISETNYDFEGAFFFKDYEWSYYVGDELNLDDLTFEVCVIDSNGTYSGEYIHNIISYSSGNYSDLYTLDISEVDMSKAGEYKIYLQTAYDAIGTFYTNKTRYLTSGDYKVKMNGEKTAIIISVEDRPTTTSIDETVTTTSTTTTTIFHDTPFYFENNFVIEKGSSDVIVFSNEENKDVKFSIDDETIAILVDPESEILEIRGLSEGVTTIRAVSSDGTSATADIKVIIPEATTTTTVYSETTTTTTVTTTTIIDPINDSTTTTTSNKYLTVWYKDKPLAKNETITINYWTEYLIPFTALGKVEAEPVSDKVSVTVDNDNKLLHLYMNEAAYVYVILHDTESNEYYTLYAYASEMGSSTTSQTLTTSSTTTTTASTDTGNSDNELPQTGYSGIYKVIVGLASLMTISGAALVVKTRKENE